MSKISPRKDSKYITDILQGKGLNAEVGTECSYEHGSISFIPIKLNDWWYVTVQRYGHQYKARISKIGYANNAQYVIRLDNLNSDNLDMLLDMLIEYINNNSIRVRA